MSMFVAEWVTLLFTLWLPTAPAGPSPSARDLFQYSPDDAVLLVGLDAKSLGRDLFSRAQAAGKLPFIAKVPRLAKRYARALDSFKQNHQKELVRVFGGDPLKLVDSASVAFRPREAGKRELVLVVLRGKISRKLFLGLVRRLGLKTRSRVGGFDAYLSEAGHQPVSLAWRRGVLLVGTNTWVHAVAKRGPRTRWSPGTLGARMVAQHQAKTLLAVGFSVTPRVTRRLVRFMDGPLRSLARGLSGGYLGVQFGGHTLTAFSGDGQTLTRFGKLLNGLADWYRASDELVEAMLQLADAFMDHRDPLRSETLRTLFRHKRSLLTYLRSRMRADKPLVRVDSGKDYRRLRVTAKASAMSMLFSGAVVILTVGTSVYDGRKSPPVMTKPVRKVSPPTQTYPKP